MKLLIAVVQNDDADQLCKRLNDENIRATRISSTGGFLALGNVTILAGVDDERVNDAFRVIRAVCHTRHMFINASPWGPDITHMTAAAATPVEVQVGGAVVFSVPVRGFARLRPGAVERVVVAQTAGAAGEAAPAEGAQDLMIAIVQSDDTNPVSQALLAAGYRLTRFNTTGAFLRRGNVTLIIGVEPGQSDAALDLIAAHCQPRPEPKAANSSDTGHSAIVFVVDAQRFPCL